MLKSLKPMKEPQDSQTVFAFMMNAETAPAVRPELAVAALNRSQTGREAIVLLYSFLAGPGMRLNREDQALVIGLVITAWSSRPGLVLRALAERINTPPSTNSQQVPA